MSLPDLVTLARDLAGRGGAGFPLERKLAALSGARRPPVVVNASEGEPASAKDAALALLAPHLVLDGAVAAALALGSRQVHLVVPEEKPSVEAAFRAALAERDVADGRVTYRVHRTEGGFVSGQSSAVLELMAGRENKPVTTWVPATSRGLGGRPTLVCNAETFAQVGTRLLRPAGPPGLPHEPGTTLLTLTIGDQRPQVCEVELGTPWAELLGPTAVRQPVLLGGYHGTWARPGVLAELVVSRGALAERGLTLGAGVVIVPSVCPVLLTARITRYLASESAGRCGPCVRGLPTLSAQVSRLASGTGDAAEVRRIAALVQGRGACAHPDGTARLVTSLLVAYPSEVEHHAQGRCIDRTWGVC